MRPLAKPFLPAATAARYAPQGLLMNALGHFCAFCERPLLAESWVWDATTGNVLPEKINPEMDWSALYLLDHNCFEAQARSSRSDLSGLLLPDSPKAFRPFDADSPLRYKLDRLVRVFTDDEGNEIGEPETIEQVVIIGTTEAACATINLFQLNTAYYRPEETKLVVPYADFLSLADRRMEQRTLAWKQTEQVAKAVKEAESPAIADALLSQLRLLVSAMGYWSSCLTAAWGVLGDKKSMREIFFPKAETALLPTALHGMNVAETRAFQGSSLERAFPGTFDIFE